MKSNYAKDILALLLLSSVITFQFCTKEEDIKPNLVQTNSYLYSAGFTRFMYIDKTDTVYSNTAGRNTLSKYLKTYGFTGAYFYDAAVIVGSSGNYANFGTFLKQLNDSGITKKAMTASSSGTYSSTGNTTKYNSSQIDAAKKINCANLELEWWNGATTWSNWNTINQQISAGTIIDNDFYEGWYQNLGTTPDTIAARDQIRYSDRILLHAYQNGIPTYSYVSGRLDVIAKGARQANKMANVYIIISSENTAWGAANTFTGPALAAAASQPNPYEYIETQAYNNIYGGMTTFQKQWIRIRGFVWFTKRFCYAAIPPR
jgi:hypothetical protein